MHNAEPVATVVAEAHFEQGRYVEHQTLKIYMDDEPLNPRTEWDNFGHMVCFHKRYDLGDEGHGITESDFESWDELENFLRREKMAAVILPVYMYDHSGITIRCGSFHDRWDSGQIGFIYATREDIRKNWNVKRATKDLLEQARKLLLAEVGEYDDYLTGNVYGYVLEDGLGNEICSAWGYYGDGAIEEIITSMHMQKPNHAALQREKVEA